jgi:hypothetical protein
MGPLVIEHIFPLSQGGATVASNSHYGNRFSSDLLF